jgi:hypothetical protein
MTARLVRNRTFEGAVHTILDDVIALLGAEYGNIQLPIGEELAIAAQRGLSADFFGKHFGVLRKMMVAPAAEPCGSVFRSLFPT